MCLGYNYFKAMSLYFIAEQYEAFLKFNYDQIQRRYGERPASCKYYVDFIYKCNSAEIMYLAVENKFLNVRIYLHSNWSMC